jgi:hypothetical protein
MTDSLTEKHERLVAQCRATLDSPPGTPLRIDKMISQHRELVTAFEEHLEFHRGYARVHLGIYRLVKKLLDAFSTGSNGHRSWVKGIHPSGKTALVLIQQFLQQRR